MTLIHVALGLALVVLNLAAGVGAFTRGDLERLRALALGAHLTLGLQVVTGFLMFTSDGPGAAHALVPIAALAVIFAVRASRGEGHPREVLAVSWAAVAAGVFGFVTGFSS